MVVAVLFMIGQTVVMGPSDRCIAVKEPQAPVEDTWERNQVIKYD